MNKVTHSMSYYTNRINTLIDKVLELDNNSDAGLIKHCESIKKNSSEIMDVFTNHKMYHKIICKIVLKMVKQVDNLLIDDSTNTKQSKIINKIYPHLDGLLYRTVVGDDEYALLKTRLNEEHGLIQYRIPFGDSNATEDSIHYVFSRLFDLNLVEHTLLNLDKHDRYYWDINELKIPSHKKHILARLLLAITNCAYDADTDTYDFGWDFRSVVNALISDKNMIISTIQYADKFDYDIIAVKFYNEYLIMSELD